ncbi:hypothetical protein [Saccharopolyspora halophila]|uniref:hypothetical protein n=1 Tax=Saccharopolyspora halophila TaxID=405551 RepID=UPI0031E09B3A
MAAHPLRQVLGVRGPLLGGPALLVRCWWLVPVALSLVAPFQLAAWSVTCHLGSCAESLSVIELLRVPDSLVGKISAHVYRGVIQAPPLILIVAATSAALTAAAAHRPSGPRLAWRRVIERARPLSALIALAVAIPVIALLVPVLLWRAIFGPLSENLATSSPDVIAISALLLVMLGGALAAFAATIATLVSAVPVLLERCSAPMALRRTLSLALKRVFPTLGTVLLVMVLTEFVDVAVDVLWTAASLEALPSWLSAALNTGLSDAISLPLTAAMYYVRYIDLRTREGFARGDLVRLARR